MRATIKIDLSPAPALELRAGMLVLPVSDEDLKDPKGLYAAANKALGGHLGTAVADEEFKAKAESSLTFHTSGKLKASRLLLLGMGKREKQTHGWETLRMAAGRAAKAAQRCGAKTLAFAMPRAVPADDLADAARAIAEGALLGSYQFDRYKSEKNGKPHGPETLVIGVPAGKEKSKELTDAVALAQVIAESTNWCRDLVNSPPNDCTPRHLADAARELARKAGLECEVQGPKQIAALKMGLFLGVTRGSIEEPRLIRMSYLPKGANAKQPPVVFVGKAITFDSGGLSLKTAEGMIDMKTDMAGSATVFAAMRVIAHLKPPFPVHALVGSCENMPGGRAYKPGDILTAYNKKTVEIINTDAEGRLVLGDVLAWGVSKYKPAAIVDLATLTGACVVALGHYTVGAFGPDGKVIEGILSAAKEAGEDFWRLPLVEAVKENLKSDVADMKNSGERWGGAISAALFLREYVGETPWVHLDIAGPSSLGKERGYMPKGGTGVGVRTLVEFVRGWK